MLGSRARLAPAFTVCLIASMAIACGGPDGNTDSGSDAATMADVGGPETCTTPCACADRGPPQYGRESAGRPSATSNANQSAALVRANHWRTSAGLNPVNANAAIEQAATAHATLMSTTSQGSCWPGTHNEVAGCPGFTGADPGARMHAAGYAWNRYDEVIDFEPDPTTAVDGWIWTVYHRLPFMDYHLADTGFGSAMSGSGSHASVDDVMDFGAMNNSLTSMPVVPVVFPVPGQTAVPTSFRGYLEGPTPPGPGGGAWPSGVSSGTVLSVHFPTSDWTVTEHHLFYAASGECNDVPHMYIDASNDPNLMGGNDVFMYANTSLLGGTDYVVQVIGTFGGAAYTRAWVFTTQ